ncbi:MAG: hypothetical protein H7837_01740 [Magnetococcus sp. MYC-9]
MNGDQSEPLQRLLQQLQQNQTQACQQILAEAEAQAAELITAATAAARAREEEAFHGEEKRLAETAAALQARQASEARQRRLRQSQWLLEQGWQLLLAQIDRRWANAGQRALWLAALHRQAEQTFTSGSWTVQHPSHWDPAEFSVLHPASCFQEDPTVTAGLRIGCRGAWLDGTLQGMMANRRQISALLLAQLEQDGEVS